MPVYEVEDPQGRTLEIEGDHVPTAEELTNIFTQAFPTTTQATQAQPAPERPALVRAPLPTMGPQGQQMLQTGMEQLSKPLINIPEKAPDFGTRLPEEVPEGILKKTGQAIGGEALKLLSGVTSPIGLASIPAMMVAPEVVGPLMAMSMAPVVGEGVKQTIAAKDIPEAARGITKTVFGGAGVAGGLLAPLHARLLPKAAEETAKVTGEKVSVAPKESEVADAIPKRETEEVPVAVPPGDLPEVGTQVREQTPTQAPKEAEVAKPSPEEWKQLLAPDVRRDLRDEGVTPENIDALLSGKKTAEQVVNEQLGVKTTKTGTDADTMIVEENPDGSRSIGFSPKAGPASTVPVNVGSMSHVDAIRMAQEQGVERIKKILEAKPPPLSTSERAEVQAELSQALGEEPAAAPKVEETKPALETLWHAERKQGSVKEGKALGMFLTNNEDAAHTLSRGETETGKVQKFQVEIKKPLVIPPNMEPSASGKPWFDMHTGVAFNKFLKDAGVKFKVDPVEYQEDVWRMIDEGGTKLVNAIRRAGYDAVKYPEHLTGRDQTTTLLIDHEIKEGKALSKRKTAVESVPSGRPPVKGSKETGAGEPPVQPIRTGPLGTVSPGPGAAASGEPAKGEMRPGAQPYDPSSGALGIKPPVPRSLRVFATQDVAPFLRKGVDLIRATKDMVINAFSPASHAKTANVDILFKSKGYSEKLMTQAGAVLEHANDLLKSRPRAEQIAFIDRVKRGQLQPTPELQDIADLIRDWDDRLYSEAKVYKPTLDYLDNHLRVLWKTIPGKTKRGLSQEQIIAKRPWRGSQGFTKRHVLDDMSQGIALGGEPVTYNPVEMFLLHAQDVMKFVSANRAWESLKGTGEVTFVKLGKQAPDDFVRIKDSIAKAYFSPKGMKGVRAQAGEWWVQKDAARMIENYLSRDYIRSYPIGRALMGLKNATTAIELGLSPFHAVFESLETTGSTFGLGLAKITSGDVVGGLKHILETPFSSKIVSKVGRAGIKYAKDAAGFQAAEPETYNWFVSKFPDAKRLIDDLFTGGGQLGMHQDYKWRAGSGFSQALQEGNYPGAVLRAIPALNQVAMKPLFETYIPRLKVGTFLREYSFELARRADDIASGKTTREALARKTWAFVEDRFGEMNFDNLYWNRTFKSALQLAFRSVTWKLGNLRGFGKAARDATAELGWKWFTEGRAPEMTLPMAWTIGMSVTTGIVSSLVTKTATGKYPWELAKDMGELVKNLVFPRISLTDESQRVSTPTYWRDAVHLSHSVPDYIKSSMSGEKGRIMDVWNNRDFYGVQVMNPDDPLPQKVAQAFQHLVPVPFGASSWLAAERTGATKGQALAGFFGFTKAPYYVSHTDAEQKALELMRNRMPQGSRTREEFERSIRERQAVEAIKRGDMTGPEAVRDGLVEQRRIKQVESRATEPLLEHLVGRLGPDDAMRVYKAAAPEEKDRIKFRIQQKILRSRTLDPARKGDLLIELER